ncbi:hypothetical protein ACPA9J_33445 [Pseudomonas aeruginosa]
MLNRFPRAPGHLGTACDGQACTSILRRTGLGNLQPGASLALNLQPGAVDVRLAPNGPGDARRNGMTILAGRTLTPCAPERSATCALPSVRAGSTWHRWRMGTEGWQLDSWGMAVTQGHEGSVSADRVHGDCLAGRDACTGPPAPVAAGTTALAGGS